MESNCLLRIVDVRVLLFSEALRYAPPAAERAGQVILDRHAVFPAASA